MNDFFLALRLAQVKHVFKSTDGGKYVLSFQYAVGVRNTRVSPAFLDGNVRTVWGFCFQYLVPTTLDGNGVFAIYQIMLGWKTCKYNHETDELPNPRPTHPKKN